MLGSRAGGRASVRAVALAKADVRAVALAKADVRAVGASREIGEGYLLPGMIGILGI